MDQLRTLAGGDRKIGRYLSGVVDWLWHHREQLQGQDMHLFAPVLARVDTTCHHVTRRTAWAVAESGAALAEIRDMRRRYEELSAAGSRALRQACSLSQTQERRSQNDTHGHTQQHESHGHGCQPQALRLQSGHTCRDRLYVLLRGQVSQQCASAAKSDGRGCARAVDVSGGLL